MVSLKQVLLHLWSDESPYCEITNSIFAPSVVVLSLIYQFLDLLLNSRSTTIKCELVEIIWNVFKAINFLTWASMKRNKFTYFRANLKFKTYSLVNENSIFSVEENFWNRYINDPFHAVIGGLIGQIHNLVFPNWHCVKEHWGRGMFLTNKLSWIYKLRHRLLKGKFLHRNVQFFGSSNRRSESFAKK